MESKEVGLQSRGQQWEDMHSSFSPPGEGWRHLHHLNSPYLVNIHHLTGDSKNGLNVVFSKFLDQLADRRVVLDGKWDIALSTIPHRQQKSGQFGLCSPNYGDYGDLVVSETGFPCDSFFCLRERR